MDRSLFAPLRKRTKTHPVSPRHRSKNPFTMSKRLALRAISPDVSGKPLLFISGNYLLLRETSLSSDLVELIGIEPMT